MTSRLYRYKYGTTYTSTAVRYEYRTQYGMNANEKMEEQEKSRAISRSVISLRSEKYKLLSRSSDSVRSEKLLFTIPVRTGTRTSTQVLARPTVLVR